MTTPEELEAIRARHEAAEKDGGHEWCGVYGPAAHTDRATLLKAVDRLAVIQTTLERTCDLLIKRHMLTTTIQGDGLQTMLEHSAKVQTEVCSTNVQGER